MFLVIEAGTPEQMAAKMSEVEKKYTIRSFQYSVGNRTKTGFDYSYSVPLYSALVEAREKPQPQLSKDCVPPPRRPLDDPHTY